MLDTTVPAIECRSITRDDASPFCGMTWHVVISASLSMIRRVLNVAWITTRGEYEVSKVFPPRIEQL